MRGATAQSTAKLNTEILCGRWRLGASYVKVFIHTVKMDITDTKMVISTTIDVVKQKNGGC